MTNENLKTSEWYALAHAIAGVAKVSFIIIIIFFIRF